MRFSLLFSLVFLSVLYLNLAQGWYEDCCLLYVKEVRAAIKRRVVNYRRQEQDGGCNLSAVVFKLKRGQLFCARPGDKWVQDLVKQIDRRIQKLKSIPAKRRYKQDK